MTALYCIAKFKAKKGKHAQMRQALSDLAEPSNKETGCLQYDMVEEMEYGGQSPEPWDFIFIEKWSNKEDFDSHCMQPYTLQYFQIVAPELMADYDMHLFQPCQL